MVAGLFFYVICPKSCYIGVKVYQPFFLELHHAYPNEQFGYASPFDYCIVAHVYIVLAVGHTGQPYHLDVTVHIE